MPSGIYSSYNKINNYLYYNGGETKEIKMIRQKIEKKKINKNIIENNINKLNDNFRNKNDVNNM